MNTQDILLRKTKPLIVVNASAGKTSDPVLRRRAVGFVALPSIWKAFKQPAIQG